MSRLKPRGLRIFALSGSIEACGSGRLGDGPATRPADNEQKGRAMNRLAKLVLAAAPLAMAASGAGADTFVRMLAGPAGGSWYPVGAKIMELMQKDIPGIRTSNAPGGGVGNVRNVDKGNAEIGFTFGHTAYNGLHAREKFKVAHPNIAFFATLFPGILQTAVPADSKIMSYRDLAGKNISPGKLTFTGNIAMEKVLKLYGITYAGIKAQGGTIHRVGYKDSVALMKDGHIDAFVGLTSVPNSSFLALDFSPGIRFLPIDDAIADKFVKQNPGYYKSDIEAGVYKGAPKPVPTLATATVLIVNRKLPDELVYQMTASFWKEHDEMAKVLKVWKDVKLATALKGAAIPVHPGALKYYKEKGVAN